MAFDHERFKNVLAGFQSLAVSVAIIAGGVWTLITFDLLTPADRARAELHIIEKKMREQGLLDLKITASPTTLPNDSAHYISAIVEISNRGDRNTLLRFRDFFPFAAHRVTFDPSGETQFHTPVRAKALWGFPDKTDLYELNMIPGGVQQLPFFVKFEEVGLYFVSFAVALSPADFVDHLKAGSGRDPDLASMWNVTSYVVVK